MADAIIQPQRTFLRFLFQAVILAVIMMFSLALYLLVLKWRGPAATVKTYIPLDDFFPFQPGWVWVYLIPYLVGPILVGILSRATFAWYVRRGLILVFLTLVIFVVYPTQTIRSPADNIGDGVTARLYHWMIEIDQPPANAAPSLHVSLTCLLAWALVRDFPRWWLPTIAGSAIVWLATLYTRQHHLIDVGTGVLLGSLVAFPWLGKRNDFANAEGGTRTRTPFGIGS
jgi:hypothetical protein